MMNNILNRYLSNFLFIEIIFVQIMSGFPNFIEDNFSNGIYRITSSIYRSLIGWIPISIGDLLYAYFIYILLKFIYTIFRKKTIHLRTYRLSIGATISVLYFFFIFNWGLNYHRVPLTTKLNIQQKEYSTALLNKFTLKTINKINSLHSTTVKNDSLPYKVPYTKSDIHIMSKIGYDFISKSEPDYNYAIPSVKNSIFSIPLSYMGFSGYLNPFTGEAQINSKIPLCNYAFTTCHEIAHQIGYATESEANFIGYLATTSHPNTYFKLSGHTTALKYLLNELYLRDKVLYQEALEKMNYGILKNIKESRLFWEKYENPFECIFKWSYNLYLTLNNQKKGIRSYNYMVDILLQYQNKISSS
jgi:hypothetical protein